MGLKQHLSESIKRFRISAEEEAKKEARAAEFRNGLRQDFLTYGTKVEGVYKKHHELRVREVQRGHKERHVERLARLESNLAATTASFEKLKATGRQEIEERAERMKNRGK